VRIGSGTYGSVFKGTDKSTGDDVAIKVVNLRYLPPEAVNLMK
jgi:serine/threonine protein kinase